LTDNSEIAFSSTFAQSSILRLAGLTGGIFGRDSGFLSDLLEFKSFTAVCGTDLRP
jgi:hypothetical protein